MSSLPAFDPLSIPVVAVDSHLPKLESQALQAQSIAARCAAPHVWTPELSIEPRFSTREPVHAAVLLALVQRAELTVLLTQRTAHLSSHSGQVAFAGGKTDSGDANATATALREAHEEIGLEPSYVQVLAELPLYRTGSGFLITPVLALVRSGFTVTPNPHEVADVFEVPLGFLMDPAHHRHHAVHWQGQRREWLSMVYQDGAQERFIWGATAAMLRNLYRFLL